MSDAPPASNNSTSASHRLRILSLLTLAALLVGFGMQIVWSTKSVVGEALGQNGLAAQRELDFETAQWSFQQAARWFPYYSGWHYLQGATQRELGMTEQAGAALERSLKTAPNDVSTLIAISEMLATAGDAEQAQAFAQRSLDIVPTSWKAHDVAGVARGIQGDDAGAAAHFERALEVSRWPRPAVMNHAASALYQQGEYDRALPYIEEALLRDRQSAEYRLTHGKILLALGRHAEAERTLTRARTTFEKSPARDLAQFGKLLDVSRYQARAQLDLGKPARAAQNFVELVPYGVVTQETDGAFARKLYRRLDTPEAARRAPVQLDLASILFAVEEHALAAEACARAIKGLPAAERTPCAVLWARALLAEDRPADALKALRSVPPPSPPDLDYALAMGDALAALGQKASAKLEYMAARDNFVLDEETIAQIEEKMAALEAQ